MSYSKRYTTGSDNKYDKTTRELGQLLDVMIADEKIEFTDGQYRLVKK